MEPDLAKVDKKTPLVVFSHSPLYKLYRAWNFWTDDAGEVQALLRPFQTVTVIHGHTHQLLTKWPYGPEGLPKLTVEMSRANPFNPHDACGDGRVDVLADGLVDKVYNLWDRNPVTVSASYLRSMGRTDCPPAPSFATY